MGLKMNPADMLGCDRVFLLDVSIAIGLPRRIAVVGPAVSWSQRASSIVTLDGHRFRRKHSAVTGASLDHADPLEQPLLAASGGLNPDIPQVRQHIDQ